MNQRAPSGKPRASRHVHRAASPTEAIYIATGVTVVSRSSLAGAVDRAAFEAALTHLEARFPILRAVVEDGHFVERSRERSAVEAWLPAERGSAEDVYATLLNAELDTSESLYAIHVIAAAERLDVFLLTSHAITDATSLIELHACLAHLCDLVMRGRTPALAAQPFPQPVDEAVSRSLASLGVVPPPAAYSGSFAEIPLRGAYEGGPLTHRLERVVVDPNVVERVREASHAAGSSVHAVLLAAFALAIREVAQGRPRRILLRSSVDMRRRLEPHVSTELVFSAITGHITPVPDLDRPLADIARLIYDDIHQGLADGRIFRDYIDYPAAFASPHPRPVALNVSDVQQVHFHWPMERLRVTGFEFALGWSKPFPNVSVSVCDGRLIANIVYAEEFAEPATIRALSENFVARLLSV